MVTKAFRECLVDVYRGEIAGEAVFESMLGSTEGAEQKYAIGSLLQLETEGKAIIRPLLLRLGLWTLDDPAGRAEGASGGAALNALPWTERFAMVRETVNAIYLPRYLELATLVSAEEDAEAARLAAFMGTHERAVLGVAENVMAGTADPVAPVAALLRFPLPRPA